MIQRYNEKMKACTYCLKPGHSQFSCPSKPRKTLSTHKGLKVSSSFGAPKKAMKKRGKVTLKWLGTRDEWFKQNPGPWVCHYDKKLLEKSEVELDHMESRTRRPDLRFDLSNLVPACHSCNEKKGSKSHDEIPHSCDLKH